jgi:hypothetical protein
MKLVALPALAEGEHVIEVWRLYTEAGELQPIWLHGEFAVVPITDGAMHIAPARDSVAFGALSAQGLPGYFGEVVYTARVSGTAMNDSRRVKLRLPSLGEVAQVRVDGADAGFVLPAAALDLSSAWRPGTRTVDVVLRIPPDALIASLADEPKNPSPHGLAIGPELVTLARAAS